MQSSKRHRWFVLLIYCLILSASVNANSYIFNQEFKLLSAQGNALTFVFNVNHWQIDTLVIHSQAFLKISFDESGFTGKSGAPMLPNTATMIGIPEQGDVTVRVIDSQYRELRPVALAPVPELTADNSSRDQRFIINDSLYQSTEWQPQTLADIAKVDYFRNQRVALIRVSPVQFLPARRIIRLYDQLTIQVQFTSPPSQTGLSSPANKLKDERLYQTTLLNYEQARTWRKSPPPTLKKAARTGDTGKMYKIPISREGIYQVTGSFLKSKGIDISTIDSRTIKLYNNGGRELPEALEDPRPDSLIENAIEMNDGGDNKFDEQDFFLFYGKPVNSQDFDVDNGAYFHYIHHYDEENIYWLTWGDARPGKRIETRSALTSTNAAAQTTTTAFYFREDESNNIFSSGVYWYGDLFTSTNNRRTYKLYLNYAQAEPEARFRFKFLGNSIGSHAFVFTLNGQRLAENSFIGSIDRLFELNRSGLLKDGLNELEISYQAGSSTAEAYLDWFEVEYRRELRAIDNELFFNAPLTSEPLNYRLTDFTNNSIAVYDITDFANVKKITNTTRENNAVTFADSANANRPRRYTALTPDAFHSVVTIEEDESSDLRNPNHGAEYIIITHEDFYEQAQRLAEHRQQFDHLSTTVVKILDIYDEFSWGLFDPVAIRDFLATAYLTWSIKPEIVLLMGDGNFDYKNNYNTSYPNFIPPFETSETNDTDSRAMDEWYTYVSGAGEIMDLSIGRLPVQTTTEARAMVDKIINYDLNPDFGTWKNNIAIIADDEYDQNGIIEYWNEQHTRDAEDLANQYIPPTFDLKKIYLVEYAPEQSASISGIRKPVAGEDFVQLINRGALIINFIGHGNETVLTHERLLTLTDALNVIQNENRLGLWVAATCAWGRYDMTQSQAMSEQILLMENRGAIAVMTASRKAFATPNARLNKLFFRQIFPIHNNLYQPGKTLPLGEALMQAKNISYSTANDQKYHLLGDPAQKLALPRFQAVIQSVTPDTLKALSRIEVQGQIYQEDQPWPDFNGKIFITAYDSKKPKTYHFVDGTKHYYIPYQLPGSAIFRGSTRVTAGQFTMNFIVPKDITYGGALGRISAYFWNDQVDGSGKRDSLVVGGTATDFVDQDGPNIEIGFKETNIGSGAVVGPQPVLQISIADSLSGINITGEIGHKIILTVDDLPENRRDITELFVFDEGSYLKGKIEYPFANFFESSAEGISSSVGLEPGEHQVTVKAWDNFNNSASRTIHFTVIPAGDFKLSNVLNYPNPFSERTAFTFVISHDAEIKIQIYTVAGRLIKTVVDYAEAGFNFTYEWDGRDEEGQTVANGVYLYRITAQSIDAEINKKEAKIGRLVLMK